MKKILIPLITCILFSGSYVAGKYTTYDLGPFTTSFLRGIIGLLFLAALLFHYKLESLKAKDIYKLILLGLLGIAGYHFFFFSALRHTEVANTAIINAMSPIVTGILAAVFVRERLSRKNYIGVVLAFVGVVILLTRGSLGTLLALNFNIGDMLMLLCVSSWAVYALIVKHLRRYNSFTLIFYATLFGVIMLFLMSLTEELRDISTASLLSVVYMGIFVSGLGYLLYNFSIKSIGPTKTASFVYSVLPIFVAFLAWLFFSEGITIPMILSIVLIVIGLNLVMEQSS